MWSILIYALAALSCICGTTAIIVILANGRLDDGDDQ